MLMEHKTLSPPKFHQDKHIVQLWLNVSLTPFLQPTQSEPFVFLWVLFLLISNICLLKIHQSILKYWRNITEINTFLQYISSYEEALFLSHLCSYSSLTEEPHFQVVEMVLVNLGFRTLHERISQTFRLRKLSHLSFIHKDCGNAWLSSTKHGKKVALLFFVLMKISISHIYTSTWKNAN